LLPAASVRLLVYPALVLAVSCLGVASAAAAPSADLRLDFKSESQNTVMTAPIGGPFLGGSFGLGSPELDLHPRAWVSLGWLRGLESNGWASEIGGTLTYYGPHRQDGFGGTIDLGVSLLTLDQMHDDEHLVAGALIAEPGVIFTRDRWSFLLAARGKDVVYERMSGWDDRQQTDWYRWKTEAGVKLGLRVAF